MPGSENKAVSGDARRCGYPRAQTDGRCRAWKLAGKQRCREHLDKPGAPPANENAVTHGGTRKLGLVWRHFTDEQREAAELADVDKATDLALRIALVDLDDFFARRAAGGVDDDNWDKGLGYRLDRVRVLDASRVANIAALARAGLNAEDAEKVEAAVNARYAGIAAQMEDYHQAKVSSAG